MRLLITGVPRSGKTTLAAELAEQLSLPVVHSDDFREIPWEFQKEAILAACPDACILEGSGACRLLRLDFSPMAVVLCEREGLESPSHRGIAGLVRSRVGEWTGPLFRFRSGDSVSELAAKIRKLVAATTAEEETVCTL